MRLTLRSRPITSLLFIQTISASSSATPLISSVCSLFSHFSIFPPNSLAFSTSRDQIQETHENPSPVDCSSAVKSTILRCSHLWSKEDTTLNNPTLKDILFKISDISPQTTRRFFRVSEFTPEYVLEILLGFDFDCRKSELEVRMVESLWEIFCWGYKQSKDFKHAPRSCEVMVSMLFQVGLLRNIEFLLSRVESQGVLLDSHGIYSDLIKGYASDGELERAISIYDHMRRKQLAPSITCCNVLVTHLVRKKESQSAYRIGMDLVEMRFNLGEVEKATLKSVIGLLCKDGKIQEARNLLKKTMAFGLVPSNLIINEMASGYSEKKDFDDILILLKETKRGPDVLVGNRILFSLCSNLGLESAEVFMQELEQLGFIPDEKTFGILIGWSCSEGKLKNAFVHLSELLSRSLEPDIHSYNSLISGVFKLGLWEHARDIFDELVERGITPNLLTFKVLLAGYFKARQFDKAKEIVREMANQGLLRFSLPEDSFSKAFSIIGLNPLFVHVKRDNGVGFSKAEFFDTLGNGLYLDTDLEEYEKTVSRILEDAMVPNFDSLVMVECGHGNLETSLTMVDEMVCRGQELSLSTFLVLLKGLCASRYHPMKISYILDNMPKLTKQLDQEAFNLLVQAYGKKGLMRKARLILDEMFQRHLLVEHKTHTALLRGLCKNSNKKDLHDCWRFARADNWLPGLEDYKALTSQLCQHHMLKEALELLQSLSSIACTLVEELMRQGWALDCTTCSHLVRGFCMEKRFADAFRILDYALAKNMIPSPDVSIVLIPHLLSAKRFENALALKENIEREQPLLLCSVYSTLISGFCKIGKAGEAANLYRDMLAKELAPDADAYNILIQGNCCSKNLRKVWELFGFIIRTNVHLSISSYRAMVRVLCEKGMVLHALRLKELMLQDGNSDYLTIFNILIFYLFQEGCGLHVNSIVGELWKKKLQLDEVTYNFLVHGYCTHGSIPSSLHLLTTMISKGFRPSNRSLRIVISCLCNIGDLGNALELSRVMESRGWNHGSIVQNAIVEGLLSRGNLQEAEEFLQRMINKDLVPDNVNYDRLIKRFCFYGRLDKSIDLLNVMLKKGTLPNSTSYDCIIHGFCARNQLDLALDFFTEMLQRNLMPSIDTWNMLVQNLCHLGRTEEAERVWISMTRMGETPTKKIYYSLINRYHSDKNLHKASELLHAMQQCGYEPDFETHWSLISNLSNSNNKNEKNGSRNFLSRLLSESGFTFRKDVKGKLR
ncbi:Pentatricopeptide repeat [Dillenia turbinata]|uniref:Pentatricopeptide repeat n=1 Tax=Dillenia turbinata TaxID=194707 RepID=A0AAN8YUM6_9MAGN